MELTGVSDGDRIAFTGMIDTEIEIDGGDKLQLDVDEGGGAGASDGIIIVSCVLKLD